jgi:hypothetical protein
MSTLPAIDGIGTSEILQIVTLLANAAIIIFLGLEFRCGNSSCRSNRPGTASTVGGQLAQLGEVSSIISTELQELVTQRRRLSQIYNEATQLRASQSGLSNDVV